MKIGQDQTSQSPTRLSQNAGWMGMLVSAVILGTVAGDHGWHKNIARGMGPIPALSGLCYGSRS